MYILENLKLFGLNKYEALAYIQIVKSGVATAKEVSRGSDVPYSRTYDVLDSLEKKEWVLVEASKPYRYRAEKIDVILDKKEKIVIYE
ncbi:MAG TPA: TrmB family transcriptional regulator, partial [Euryarchaeota archaeon]|nr:TrmB family transcriptional regulator [Euryarchaeota archaeon]